MEESLRDASAIDLLIDQHDAVRTLLQSIAAGPSDARRSSFEELVRMLAVHETAEEEVVHPRVRKIDEQAARIIEQRLTEESAAKSTLARLEGMEPESEEFLQLFLSFRVAVEDHAEAEELEEFPRLRQALALDELKQMGRTLQLAEAMAPTHAHRAAPTSAVGNMLVGPFVSMVDRVRDAIRDGRRSAAESRQ
jgi:hemerythrin superfamily protein